MWLNSGLEEEHAEWAICIRLDFYAFGIHWCLNFVNEWHNVAKEFHHAANTHIFQCAYAEHWANATVDKPLADTFTHFVFAECALLEEFVHKGFVVFCCHFHQCLVHFCCAVLIFRSDVGDCWSTTFRTPSELLHDEHVNDRVEVRTCSHWELDRNHLVAESLFKLVDQIVVVNVFCVHLVEGENHRLVDFCGCSVDILSANLNAILAVYNDNAGISNVKCCHSISHEVVHAWAVNNIQFLVVELSIEYC